MKNFQELGEALMGLPMPDTRNWVEAQRILALRVRLCSRHSHVELGDDRVLRYIQTGNIVPPCVLSDAGLEVWPEQRAAADAELRVIAARMAKHVPDGEELAEMRAAFGPGERIVNLLTGKETQL